MFFKVPGLIFHGSRWFKVPSWFLVVPSQFLWSFKVSRLVFHGSIWVFMVFQGSVFYDFMSIVKVF